MPNINWAFIKTVIAAIGPIERPPCSCFHAWIKDELLPEIFCTGILQFSRYIIGGKGKGETI
jgi:hypothetical protein